MKEELSESQPSFETEAFEDWLEQVATSKETSKQEVLDQMISSYWFLDELGDVLEDSRFEGTDIEVLFEQREQLTDEISHEGDHSLSDEIHASDNPTDGVLDLIDILKDVKDSSGHAEGHEGAYEELDHTVGRTEVRQFDIAREIVELRSELEGAVSQLQALESQTTTNREANEDLEARVEQLDRTIEKTNEPLDGEELPDSVENLANQISSNTGAVERGLRNLDRRISNHATKSLKILEYLLDQLDKMEPQIDALDEDVTRIKSSLEAQPEHRDLNALKRSANRGGVELATCESCDQRVRIALLDRLACPHCGQSVAAIRSDSGWLRTTHYLTSEALGADSMTADPTDLGNSPTGATTGEVAHTPETAIESSEEALEPSGTSAPQDSM